MGGSIEIDTSDPGGGGTQPRQRTFYRPDRQSYAPRSKIINPEDITAITEGWPLSDSIRADDREMGSLLENNFPWQIKWYLRFEPPKSAEELDIGSYWRYDSPKLEQFIADNSEKQPTAPPLTKTSLSSLKNIATKVLSGITQESLVENGYQKTPGGRGSVINDHDGGASTVSSHLRTPAEGQGSSKRSILPGITPPGKRKTNKSESTSSA